MSNETKHKTEYKDKRCIKLKKAFVLEAKHLGQTGNSSKMSLGYFDSIEINQLTCVTEDCDWLEAAWKYSIKLSGEANTKIYEHPLYITAQGDEAWKKKIDAFWKLDTQFQLVTFVHFVTQEGEPCDFFTEVERKTEKIVRAHTAKKVSAVCYHSIDVSDMILIWKSDYLVEALKCLREVYFLDQIGDLHTICSFTPNIIVTPEQDEVIAYISLRFGVKDAKWAQDFFAKVKESGTFDFMKKADPYITTGTEDIDVTLKYVKVSDFLLLMKMISGDGKMNKVFCNAFSESATHLGISHLGKEEPRKITVSQELPARCELLLSYFQKVRESVADQETDPAYSWVKLVSVQLNALISMSRLCVLDRFCYLIMDSVQAFCEIFGEWVERKEPMTSERLRMIQKFVRAWGVLMDQTVRADGQFTQDTGVNPVFYDIPVSLLEFYIAFTRRCMRLLQMFDGEEKKEHGLFLMPNLCRRTKVEDVFDNPPPAKRLLYVDVPLDYLYRPRQVFYQLCHEISHFCGEKPRSRATRAQTFIMNCAQLIVQRLHIEGREVTRAVYEELRTALNTGKTPYMRETAKIIWKKMYQLLTSKENVQRWIEKYLEGEFISGRVKEDKRYGLISEYERNLERIIQNLKNDVERLVRLYTECYADVSMIFMLQTSCTEYILLYHQEQNWIDMQTADGAGRYHELVQRIALVLLTVFEGKFNQTAETDKLSKQDIKIWEDAQELASSMKRGDGNPQIYLPCCVLRQISEYLKYSYGQLNKMYAGNQELDRIRSTFYTVTEDFSDATEAYRETIYLYEKEIQDNKFWKDRKI